MFFMLKKLSISNKNFKKYLLKCVKCAIMNTNNVKAESWRKIKNGGDKMYDVLVIGAGVIGCAVARELSKLDIKVCVVEKESDVCEGTSKANSAIIHAGFDAEQGSLKAKLNVRGSEMMAELSEKLDFDLKNNGALVLCFDEKQLDKLEELKLRGEANGVKGLEIISGDKARELEPNLSEEVAGALFAPTSAIVCPFEMTLAFAENALANGVEFKLCTKVTAIKTSENGFVVSTDKGEMKAELVINCAGIYAGEVHNMVCGEPLKIIPRKGEYMLFDKEAGNTVSRTIFQLPTQMGKGTLVTPTVHGNLLVGPTAVDIDDNENVSTTAEGLAEIKEKGALSIKNLPFGKVITSFTGLRAVGETHDFLIGEASTKGFIDVAGIESPGLSSAPAIGEMVREIVAEKLGAENKSDFVDTRKGIVKLRELPAEEQNKLIESEPAYGNIVCRCETVTEGEILDAINRPLGATTLDGVKRRTRAGMGRCQAGFCSPRTMILLAEKLGIKTNEVQKNGRYKEEGERHA